MNSVCLVGRFYGSPKTNIRRGAVANGKQPFVRFTLGTWNFVKKEVEYFDVVAFGKTAMTVLRFFAPRRSVGVSGKLTRERFQTKDGREVAVTVVTAFNLTIPTDGDVKMEDIDNGRPAIDGYHYDGEPPPESS